MAPSSSVTVTADDERLTCDRFSLSEPIRLGNFEVTANYFSDLSLSPMRGYEGTTFVGSTRSGASNP
jgi:hypothetical protein